MGGYVIELQLAHSERNKVQRSVLDNGCEANPLKSAAFCVRIAAVFSGQRCERY